LGGRENISAFFEWALLERRVNGEEDKELTGKIPECFSTGRYFLLPRRKKKKLAQERSRRSPGTWEMISFCLQSGSKEAQADRDPKGESLRD